MIVAFGDSITYAQHLDREFAWTTLLENRLGQQIANRGVCGDTTRLALERYSRDVRSLEPTTVIVQFGLNDCNRWETDKGLPRVSRQAFVANLHEILDHVEADGAKAVLCTPTKTLKPGTFNKDAAVYASLVCHVAMDRGCSWFNAWSLVPISRETLLDDLHLNALGNSLYAEGLVKCLV